MPTPELLERARRLFAEALESPGGLRIQTIHAFCERLLKRFPLEAGVVPQFSVLDERATEELLEAAKDKVLRDAASHDAGLADALAAITEHAGEERFDVLMRGIAGERGWVQPFLLKAQETTLERKLWRVGGAQPRGRRAQSSWKRRSARSIRRRCAASGRRSIKVPPGTRRARRLSWPSQRSAIARVSRDVRARC